MKKFYLIPYPKYLHDHIRLCAYFQYSWLELYRTEFVKTHWNTNAQQFFYIFAHILTDNSTQNVIISCIQEKIESVRKISELKPNRPSTEGVSRKSHTVAGTEHHKRNGYADAIYVSYDGMYVCSRDSLSFTVPYFTITFQFPCFPLHLHVFLIQVTSLNTYRICLYLLNSLLNQYC